MNLFLHENFTFNYESIKGSVRDAVYDNATNLHRSRRCYCKFTFLRIINFFIRLTAIELRQILRVTLYIDKILGKLTGTVIIVFWKNSFKKNNLSYIKDT